MPILALLPQILALAPTVVTGVAHFWNWITAIREAAKQSGEWTDELEAAFQAGLVDRQNSDAWKTDSEV